MADEKLFADPLLPWDGPNPFVALARLGVGPSSSNTEVLDASFKMTRSDRNDPAVHGAWRALRSVPQRLVLEVFCGALSREAPSVQEVDGWRARLPRELIEAFAKEPPPLPAEEWTDQAPRLPAPAEVFGDRRHNGD